MIFEELFPIQSREDSIDGHIQLFGIPHHLSYGAVDDESIANDFILYQNYPNPFNPTTMIEYKLLQATDVKFNVFNILGEKVFEQNFGYQIAGSYKVNFDEQNLPSGVYVYSIYTNENRLSRKMCFY
ncbi:MAG: T9SS type A sorting domain-containing protein [Ignavibacteriales bacterium]|nr:T9SS type A sorting domain-containing protein [Ignavibacteriales bacterium]